MSDKKHIVVVGASSGIGQKVAELLLEDYVVTGTYYNNPNTLDIFKNNPSFTSYSLDLKNSSAVKEFADSIQGNLYAIVNCSGIVKFEGKNVEDDLSIWEDIIGVNLSGNYYLGKILAEKLESEGRLIMVSSTDAYYGGAITASYAASKSGINSLTKSFSLSLQDKKIRVNAIAPGWVETAKTMENGDEFVKRIAEVNPLKRNAQPLDVANLVKFLLSEQADFINGQVISIEGGYTNQDPTLLIEEDMK